MHIDHCLLDYIRGGGGGGVYIVCVCVCVCVCERERSLCIKMVKSE